MEEQDKILDDLLCRIRVAAKDLNKQIGKGCIVNSGNEINQLESIAEILEDILDAKIDDTRR